MDKDKIVAALDIGTTKICAIVGKMNQHGTLEILGVGNSSSEGVTRGLITNIEKTTIGIQKAIEQASAQSGVDIRVVTVGIAGQYIKSSTHKGSIMRENAQETIGVEDLERLTNDMYKLVMPAGVQIIHVMPQDYTVDNEYGVKDPVGMVGSRLEADFHVIAARTDAVSNIIRSVDKAKLEIANIVLEPIASSMAVLAHDEKEAGVVLVDIGGGTTDIAMFYEGIIRHTAVIPFGGSIITNDIKSGCLLLPKDAEKLKVKFGYAMAAQAQTNQIVSIPGVNNRPPKEISVKNLAYIIEARMEEIIDIVFSEIVSSRFIDKMTTGVVLTGGGAQLNALKDLFEMRTGLECRLGYPTEYLGKSKLEAMKNPIYATAIGLVLAGFKSVDERENQYKSQQNKVRQPAEHGSGPFTRIPLSEEKKKTTRDKISELFGNYKDKFFGDLNETDY
jgi:cell division protein FtsA